MRVERTARHRFAATAMVLSALAAFVSGALDATARGEEKTFTSNDVHFRLSNPLPVRTGNIGSYVVIELANDAADTREVSVFAGIEYGEPRASVARSVRLGAGDEVRLEVVLPQLESTYGMNDVTTRCVTSGSGVEPRVVHQSLTPLRGEIPFALVVPANRPGFVHDALDSEFPTLRAVAFGLVPFADLPSRADAWHGVRGAVVDLKSDLPEPDALAALAAYARRGGAVALCGRSASDLRRLVPAFAPWIDERFLLEATDAGAVYLCGFGRLAVVLDPRLGLFTGETASDAKGALKLIERTTGDSSRNVDAAGFVERDLRLRAATIGGGISIGLVSVILIVASFVLGPVCLFATRRSPLRLLWLVPLAATGASLVMVLASVAAYGVDVRRSSATIELLDCRTQDHSVIEVRALRGAALGAPSLAPEAGTSIVPVDARRGDDRSFAIGFDEGERLAGDYLPPRAAVEHRVYCDRTSRLRVVATDDGGQWRVQNLLGERLTEVVLKGPDGEFYAPADRDAAIEPGAEATFQPIDSSDAADRIAPANPGGAAAIGALQPDGTDGSAMIDIAVGSAFARSLPKGSLFARLPRPLFRDDCGLEIDDATGAHAVVVVFDPESGR